MARRRQSRRPTLLLPSLERLEGRLAPAVFTIANGDVAGLITAVNVSNANGQDDTINLAPAGSYRLTAAPDGSDGGNGLPTVLADGGHTLTVNGGGATVFRDTVSGTPNFRILRLGNLANVTLNDLTLKNGSAGNFNGGAVSVPTGTLTLNRCALTGNQAARGGAVYCASPALAPYRLALAGCTLTGNQAAGSLDLLVGVSDGRGGAVYSTTVTSVTDCRVADNTVNTKVGNVLVRGLGAGLYLSGSVTTIDRCTIASNAPVAPSGSTLADGGGIYSEGGTLTVQNSTVSGNRVGYGTGGGVRVIDGRVTLTNTTVSGNQAVNGGGLAFLATGSAAQAPDWRVQNSTVTANTVVAIQPGAVSSGVGVYVEGGSKPKLGSTIVAGNRFDAAVVTGVGPDAAGDFTSLGHNLVGSPAGLTGFANGVNGDVVGTAAAPADPRLGPLADNGGPTFTHALLAGSQAIDAGSNPAGLAWDQRGAGFARVIGTAADIGAFEVQRPARVAAAAVNGGQAQRSRVTEVTVTFSQTVTLPAAAAAAFRLTRTGPGGAVGDVAVSVDLSGSTASQTVARLTFAGPLTTAGSLIDGDYTLTVLASQALGPGGSFLDGDGDGQPGGDYALSLYRFFGDANGDRKVDAVDLFAFAGSYGRKRGEAGYLDSLDSNADGVIDALDLFAFAANFGKTLP